MMPNQDERYWQAVIARQRVADQHFVYAVATTGVYCRPGCPSRRPLRANVAFYDNPAAAERAGYRPCQRCRPERAADDASARAQEIGRIIDAALNNGERAPSLAALGAAIGLSRFHLQRMFKRTLGISPREYADAKRLARVKARLRDGEDVASALYDAGYGSASRLYEHADAQLGMTPATYRTRGAGAAIRYATTATPLGRVLVAATARGLCAVMLGEDEAALARTLAGEFPAATITHEEKGLGRWLAALVKHLEGKEPQLDLPLDVRATGFERRVWRELMAIPYGATATYAEIARRIGQPHAARAVGHACAVNPVAIVIPCHRVVRGDGALGGYRWGVARKAQLLAQEKAAAS